MCVCVCTCVCVCLFVRVNMYICKIELKINWNNTDNISNYYNDCAYDNDDDDNNENKKAKVVVIIMKRTITLFAAIICNKFQNT